MSLGTCRDASPRLDFSHFHHFLNQCVLYDLVGSTSEASCQNVELVFWSNPSVLVSLLSLCSAMLLVAIGPQSARRRSPNSLICRRVLRMVHTEQVDLRQRFLRYPIPCESRLIIPLGLGIPMGWQGTWDNPVNEFALSCNSWIWTINWFTVEGFSSFCVESSSYFNCRDLSASAQQILRYSSISWPSPCAIFLESFVSHF